jgi:hypothetical protein
MEMGRPQHRERQGNVWVAYMQLATAPGHSFYDRLNAVLEAEGFDRSVEDLCAKAYAPQFGHPSLASGIETPMREGLRDWSASGRSARLTRRFSAGSIRGRRDGRKIARRSIRVPSAISSGGTRDGGRRTPRIRRDSPKATVLRPQSFGSYTRILRASIGPVHKRREGLICLVRQWRCFHGVKNVSP